MKKLAVEGSRLPEIQLLAVQFSTPEALDVYLRRYWRVKPDPVEAEFIRHPRLQIEHAKSHGYYEGDCDDAATFAAAICCANRLLARFVAYRLLSRSEYSHVNVVCGDLMIDPVTPVEQLPLRGVGEVMELWL